MGDPAGKIRIANAEERINRALAERVEATDARGEQSEEAQPAAEAAPVPAFEDLPQQDAEAHDAYPWIAGPLPEQPQPQVLGPEPAVEQADEMVDNQGGDGMDEAANVDTAFMLQDEVTALVLNTLAGGTRAYARERRSAVKKLVCEVFSPPRLTNLLSKFPSQYLAPGFSLDLTCVDPADGEPWDFDRIDKQERAMLLVKRVRPMFLVGSPVCKAWSSWQALNEAKGNSDLLQRERARSLIHLQFCIELYKEQMNNGRFFLHEHPEFATSWQTDCMKNFMSDPRVFKVRGDQCQYGQEVRYGRRQGSPVLKPTGFISNGHQILEQLQRRCDGPNPECSRPRGGQHVQCEGRVARDAARYPDGLCRAILRGMVKQLRHDGILQDGVAGMQAREDTVEAFNLNECSGYCSGRFRDDLTGQPLIDELVMEARRKELDYFTSKGVWVKRPKAEARTETGKGAVSVRWVDVNKGDDISPRYRSRLVARQLKAHDHSGANYFSPSPPLEALRTVISLAVTTVGEWRPDLNPKSPTRTQISTLDISRAYFNAKKDPNDVTYVQLPEEDEDWETKVAKLVYHMYGTRGAADGWQETYSTSLVTLGFRQGDSSACVFVHPERGLICSVHGDDFTTVGGKANLDWFEGEMKKLYELTVGPRLGPGDEDDKEGTVLNRVIRYTTRGVEYEADPRQCEKFVGECGMAGANSVCTPGTKEASAQILADKELEAKLHTPYRASAARANYLAADRPDGQFAAKEVCRWMAKPTECSWAALKRLARFFTGLPRLVYVYEPQEVQAVDVYVDTDWAGCSRTRKSTSGGCVMMGRHAVKTWSSTQPTVALSSGEAEFTGVLKGSGIGLGYQSLLADLGIRLPLRVWTDSAAAIGVCSRQGLGKLRHIDTHLLWIQQAVRCKRVDLRKIPGETNPADLFTKHLASRERLAALVQLLGCEYRDGRAKAAPLTRTTEGGRATIGEAFVVEERPCMPHMEFTQQELDSEYPPIVAPEDLDCSGEAEHDSWDLCQKLGLKVIEAIRNKAASVGRKRYEPEDSHPA